MIDPADTGSQELKQLLRRMDANGDGMVQREEFLLFFLFEIRLHNFFTRVARSDASAPPGCVSGPVCRGGVRPIDIVPTKRSAELSVSASAAATSWPPPLALTVERAYVR